MRARRTVSLWLPRLAAERVLRLEARAGGLGAEPFAIAAEERGGWRLASLDAAAEAAGLRPGMPLADARAVCPTLRTAPADPTADADFLERLARWAGRYSPWIARDGADGLALDISGCAHLFGGEAALLGDMSARLAGMGLTARLGLADGKGAAWALARFAAREGRPAAAPPGANRAALAPLPPACLRLAPEVATALERLGLASVALLAEQPRGALARRFGAETLRRLDQAFGIEAEPTSPLAAPRRYAARLSFPEPLGLREDLLRALDRLLARLAERLTADGLGARRLGLTLRRVDRRETHLTIGLARPSRNVPMMRALFESPLDGVDSGFGIDALRLEAEQVEPIRPRQSGLGEGAEGAARREDALAELLSRLGGRFGFERLTRLAPGEAHPPDRATIALAAAYAEPAPGWEAAAAARPPRPLSAFAPEPIAPLGSEREAASAPHPPRAFRWRGGRWRLRAALGPERIAPEWWLDDPGWRTGPRDYWRVEAMPDRREKAGASPSPPEALQLWLFSLPERRLAAEATPQGEPLPGPDWFIAGVFG